MLFTGDGKLMSSCNLENVFFILCFTIVLHFIFGASCVRDALHLLVLDLASENSIHQILSFQLHGSLSLTKFCCIGFLFWTIHCFLFITNYLDIRGSSHSAT
jgi:hypothetical protein